MKNVLMVAIVLILVTLACGGDEPQAVDTTTITPIPPQTFSMGQPVQVGNWILVVHGVDYPIGGDWQPQEGNRFIVVDVEITDGGEGGSLAAGLDMELKDGENRTYTNWITSAAPSDEPDGTFAAGEVKRGLVVFQAPMDATGFVFVFQPSLAGGRAFVELD